jgi:hypothetical protein
MWVFLVRFAIVRARREKLEEDIGKTCGVL